MSIRYPDAAGPPGMRLYAIGDVHGRLDLLARMYDRIDAEIAHDRPDDWRIVHLGDYVDRGPHSAGVLELLVARSRTEPRHLCLAGNHDLGFLDFLADPDGGGLFARYGGRETAASYGVDLGFDHPDALRLGWAELSCAVPGRHRAFLRGLPFSQTFGDFYFCHAGIRPGVPLDRQKPDDLVWIRQEFHDCVEPHPKVIVHGHTPHAEPEIRDNRVNVDTAAFASGRLTALVIEGTAKRFLQATV